MPRERSAAFAPGRVNLIGEHTDYNRGLALPFAIAEGVTVRAQAIDPASAGRGASTRTRATSASTTSSRSPTRRPPKAGALSCAGPSPSSGVPASRWWARACGSAARCPPASGLSSSAALEVALCLALIELGSDGRASDRKLAAPDRIELARLCARVENDWVGAQTGLLDQLASLYGAEDTALRIDFRSLAVEPVPLALGGWRLFVLDSGERHVHAGSGYNRRRSECAAACELLGVASLREADSDAVARLPQPLQRRAGHVLDENRRVREAIAALSAQDLPALGELLGASHASLRDRYEVSTPAVEATVERLRQAGAAGARLVGGGFGGSVLGLFAPDVHPPAGAHEVRPGAGARLLKF